MNDSIENIENNHQKSGFKDILEELSLIAKSEDYESNLSLKEVRIFIMANVDYEYWGELYKKRFGPLPSKPLPALLPSVRENTKSITLYQLKKEAKELLEKEWITDANRNLTKSFWILIDTSEKLNERSIPCFFIDIIPSKLKIQAIRDLLESNLKSDIRENIYWRIFRPCMEYYFKKFRYIGIKYATAHAYKSFTLNGKSGIAKELLKYVTEDEAFLFQMLRDELKKIGDNDLYIKYIDGTLIQPSKLDIDDSVDIEENINSLAIDNKPDEALQMLRVLINKSDVHNAVKLIVITGLLRIFINQGKFHYCDILRQYMLAVENKYSEDLPFSVLFNKLYSPLNMDMYTELNETIVKTYIDSLHNGYSIFSKSFEDWSGQILIRNVKHESLFLMISSLINLIDLFSKNELSRISKIRVADLAIFAYTIEYFCSQYDYFDKAYDLAVYLIENVFSNSDFNLLMEYFTSMLIKIFFKYGKVKEACEIMSRLPEDDIECKYGVLKNISELDIEILETFL